MREIVNRLQENRNIERAKSILENHGYKVDKRLKESKTLADEMTDSTPKRYLNLYKGKIPKYLETTPENILFLDGYDDYDLWKHCRLNFKESESTNYTPSKGSNSGVAYGTVNGKKAVMLWGGDEVVLIDNSILEDNGYKASKIVNESAKSELKDLWWDSATNSTIYDITSEILDIDDEDENWIDDISEEDAQRVLNRYHEMDEYKKVNESRSPEIEQMMDYIDSEMNFDRWNPRVQEIEDILMRHHASEDDSGEEGLYATMSDDDIRAAYNEIKNGSAEDPDFSEVVRTLLSSGFEEKWVENSEGSVSYYVKGSLGVLVSEVGDIKIAAKNLL